jgi:hypothetical protein
LRVEKKLSATALSEQLPGRLRLERMLSLSSTVVYASEVYWQLNFRAPVEPSGPPLRGWPPHHGGPSYRVTPTITPLRHRLLRGSDRDQGRSNRVG